MRRIHSFVNDASVINVRTVFPSTIRRSRATFHAMDRRWRPSALRERKTPLDVCCDQRHTEIKSITFQAPASHSPVTKLLLDHPQRMLHRGAQLRHQRVSTLLPVVQTRLTAHTFVRNTSAGGHRDSHNNWISFWGAGQDHSPTGLSNSCD